MSLKPLSREIWLRMLNEMEFQDYMRYYSYYSSEVHALKKRIDRGRFSDLGKLEALQKQLRKFKIAVKEHRKRHDELVIRRDKLYKDIFKLSSEILEDIRSKLPTKGYSFGQQPARPQDFFDIFARKVDITPHIIVKHLSYFCMERHGFVEMYGDRLHYRETKPYDENLPGLGETVLIVGHKFREAFHVIIEERRLLERDTADVFIQRLNLCLLEVFNFCYRTDNEHVTFLLLISFAMEVIYCIRKTDTGRYGRGRMIMTLYILANLLSGGEFKSSCGLKKLLWYGNAVHTGQIEVSKVDAMGERLWKNREPSQMPWDYLESNSSYISVEQMERLQRLERYPAGIQFYRNRADRSSLNIPAFIGWS